jgi:transcription elongation factor S-II
VRTAKSDGVSGGTGDPTRNKCLELIYDALACDSGAPSDQIFGRAKGIEAAVHTEFSGTTATYKSRIRSLFVNLKDKNNPGLRESVVSGDLPVQRFSKMTSQVRACLSL